MIRKKQQKAEWMTEFEKLVLELEPKYAGRIEWPSAEFFYSAGDSARAAAEQYVDNRETEERKPS